MNEDDLKRYTVQVASGSGCFFQPLSDSHTYILTSRHLFCDQQQVDGITNFIERAGVQIVPIKYYVHDGNQWETREFQLTLTRGENYFSHANPQVDAAILKIAHIENCDQIIIYNDHQTPTGFRLCGHPSNRRNQGDPYTTYLIQGSIASTNFGQTVQLALGNVTQDHIEGMSGGGILKPDRSAILIAGIQSKMLSVILPAGQVAFVPIKYYAEVVESSDSHLEKLLPLYLKSFKYIKEEIFKLSYGVEEQEIAEQLTVLLKGQATRIIESDITPLEIRKYLEERLMLILPKQSNTELEKKKIWVAWLELMTILNIAYSQNHTLEDLPSLLKKIRLFYSDAEDDFFYAHLDDLDKLDYTGLEKGGVVVVASNFIAKGKKHILRPDRIPRIDSLRKQHTLEGLAIDNATEYPLDKFKFMNISAFKEGCIVDTHEEYQKLEVKDYLGNLKKQYEQLFG